MSLKLRAPSLDSFVPDGSALESALDRTTHLGIGAHPDDLEILAIDGILAAYESPENSFTGITLTDGAGTPRTGPYADYSDERMVETRIVEQHAAATIGRYGAQLMLGYTSAQVKDAAQRDAASDIETLIERATPRIVYTHNFWDKHETHVAVTCRVVEALRALAPELQPEKLYGVEVWRDLDWLPDDQKVVFDCSAHVDLQAELIAAFQSQIAGGKRYDHAVLGRRRAHATYLDPHQPDTLTHATYAIDMTALITEPDVPFEDWVDQHSRRFTESVQSAVRRLRGG